MAYTINKTDGTNVLGGTKTLADGTSDNSTSLTLFGKSFSNFGEFLNENQIKLLENSASTTAPAAPLRGELWFDTTVNILKVYDGTSFKPAGGSKSSATAPTNPGAGDLWTDSDDDQLYVYTGSAWQLVGPVYTKGQTLSGWKIETLGSSGGNKVVSSMYAGNTRVAIVSKETFTPSVTQTGFAEIKAGLTLNSTLGAVFDGTNTQAAQIDVTSTTNTSGTIIAGGNFVRADAADSMTGALTVDADGGIVIGDAQELSITVTSNNVTVAQTSQDKDLSFTINDGGVTKTPLTFEGDSGNITLTGTTTITGNTTVTGNLTITGEFENSSSEINIVNDAFLKLNTGNLEADAGIIVETTDTDDARLFYDVSENRWSAGENQSYSLLMRESDATADGNANKNTKFLRTTAAGLLTVTNMNLAAVGSAITTSMTSSTSVPTIGQVSAYGAFWNGSEKYVSTSNPTGGDGNDGDIWFVREA